MKTMQVWLADGLTRMAAGRVRRRYPDWADAMLSEHASLDGNTDQLGWAFGSCWASFCLMNVADALYPALLLISVAAMTLYQWSADESLITLSILSGLGLALGFLRPDRFVVSGLAIGVVVAAVNGFETLSGVHPAYELHHHTWLNDLRWLLLLAPALISSALGRQLGRLLPV